MTHMMKELRQVVRDAGGEPVHLLDPETNSEYVVLPIEEYARLKPDAVEAFDAREMYPHMIKTFGPTGWDDPLMDEYNDLDPRHKP